MRIRRILANGCGVISTLWLAYAVTLTLLLDAPAFTFSLAPFFLLSFLTATALAVVASIFASRWWLFLVALWFLPAVGSIAVLSHFH
jgi:hypothetical protein